MLWRKLTAVAETHGGVEFERNLQVITGLSELMWKDSLQEMVRGPVVCIQQLMCICLLMTVRLIPMKPSLVGMYQPKH